MGVNRSLSDLKLKLVFSFKAFLFVFQKNKQKYIQIMRVLQPNIYAAFSKTNLIKTNKK